MTFGSNSIRFDVQRPLKAPDGQAHDLALAILHEEIELSLVFRVLGTGQAGTIAVRGGRTRLMWASSSPQDRVKRTRRPNLVSVASQPSLAVG